MQKFREEIFSESEHQHLMPYTNETEKYFTLTITENESDKTWHRTISKFISLNGSKVWQEGIYRKKEGINTKLSLSEDFSDQDDEDESKTESSAAAPNTEYNHPPYVSNLRQRIRGDEISKRLQSDVSNAENKHNSKGIEEEKPSEYKPLMQFLERKSVQNSTFQRSSQAGKVQDFIKGN